MTIDEFRNKIIQNFEGVVKNLPKKLNILVEDLSQSIRQRVEESGINSKGQKFSDYSKNEGYFQSESPVKRTSDTFGRPWKSDGKKRNKFANGKKHKTKWFGDGYDGYKMNVDRNLGFKNFALSGQMWRFFHLKEKAKLTGSKIIATIGARTEYSQNLIEKHSEIEGINIAGHSLQEEAILIKELKDYINAELKIGL